MDPEPAQRAGKHLHVLGRRIGRFHVQKKAAGLPREERKAGLRRGALDAGLDERVEVGDGLEGEPDPDLRASVVAGRMERIESVLWGECCRCRRRLRSRRGFVVGGRGSAGGGGPGAVALAPVGVAVRVSAPALVAVVVVIVQLFLPVFSFSAADDDVPTLVVQLEAKLVEAAELSGGGGARLRGRGAGLREEPGAFAAVVAAAALPEL